MDGVCYSVVALDLDGTLLLPDRSYDHHRFARLLDRCDELDVRLVIASGRAYSGMIRMFDEPERLAFVGDNGSMIVDRGARVVNVDTLDSDIVSHVLDAIERHPGVTAVISGRRFAWMRRDASPWMHQVMPTAYANLRLVDSLREVDDDIVKFSLTAEDEHAVGAIAQALSDDVGHILTPVTSGHRGIDLIQPGHHKAHGLSLLLAEWNRAFSDVIAFGDSANDAELLAAAKCGYAMANAQPAAIEAAARRAPSNLDGGVFVVLEKVLLHESTFSRAG